MKAKLCATNDDEMMKKMLSVTKNLRWNLTLTLPLHPLPLENSKQIHDP